MRKQIEFEDKVGNTCIAMLSQNVITDKNNIRIGPIMLDDNTYNSPMVLDETLAKSVAAYLIYYIMFNTLPTNESAYLEIIKQINDLQSFGRFYTSTFHSNIIDEVNEETRKNDEVEQAGN